MSSVRWQEVLVGNTIFVSLSEAWAGFCQWRAEYCSSGVGGGIYVPALWMWESYWGSHEKTGQLPPTLSHGLTRATLGSHCSVTPLTFVSYRLLEAGSVLYCSLMAGQEILFIQINGMLLKHHYWEPSGSQNTRKMNKNAARQHDFIISNIIIHN